MSSYLVFLGLILTTVYFGLIYGSAAFMLLSFMEVAFFVVSFGWLIYSQKRIKVKLDVPLNISESGKENLVKIIVHNNTNILIKKLKVYIVTENKNTGYKHRKWFTISNVLPGVNTFIQNVVFEGTGNYEISLKKYSLFDVTGIISKRKKLKKIRSIQVMPKIHHIPVTLSNVTKFFYGEADVYDDQKAGHDNSELFQIREYKPGDRIQNVHWKMTAKQGEIMVKENSLPKACPIILLLNYNPEGDKKKRNQIHYLETVVSLSFSMMDVGCAHYIVWYDKEYQDIKRIRVDDEESLFYFMGKLMKLEWEKPKEDLAIRYDEKFKNEPYVWELSFDEKLHLYKSNELLADINGNDLEKALSMIDLLL